MLTKVTIVLPVYNVAPYITECMNSIYAQTISNIEVFWVDDHGIDESIALLKQFIAHYRLQSTWHIISTPCNSGPSVARNMAIQQAKGEYILFVDADDWIESPMLEHLYRNAKQYDADISSCNAVLDYEDGHHTYWRNPQVPVGELTKSNRRYLLRNYVSNFTTMLFRRDWLLQNGIVFPLARSGEDSSFVGQCYLSCRKIVQIDNLYYHYRIHSDSLSHRKHIYRGQQKRIAFRALIDYARAKGLLPTYRWTLYWVYFKKAVVTSALDYIVSIMAK